MSGEPLTFGGVCAGILGFELGLTQAGLEPRWVAEIDPKCSRLIAERAPGIPNYGDIRGVSFRYGKGWKKYRHPGPVDVMVGGFPCQDVSVAGKRAGLAGKRSGLWFEFLRLITEARPQWAVIENVPGLLSSNGGRDFAVILSGLAQIGYSTAWRILDAQYYGVAQRRRRVFIVASLGNGRCAEVLFERESLSWDTAPGRETGKGVAGTITPRVGGSGRGWPRINEADGLVANPIASHNGRNSGEDNFVPVAFAQNTRDEVRLQGGDGAISGALAAQPGMKQQTYVAYTIQTNDGGNHKRKDRPAGGMYVKEAESALTVGSSDQTVVAFQPRYYTRDNKTGGAPSATADITNAHKAGDSAPVVAFDWQSGGDVRLNCNEHHTSALQKSQTPAVMRNGVRRLTPTECERLQGFPDGWTANGQSDSARYRQLGNAVCVREARWLGQQLMRATQCP